MVKSNPGLGFYACICHPQVQLSVGRALASESVPSLPASTRSTQDSGELDYSNVQVPWTATQSAHTTTAGAKRSTTWEGCMPRSYNATSGSL